MTIHKVNCIHYSRNIDVSPYTVVLRVGSSNIQWKATKAVKIIIEEMMLETVKPH